MDGKLWNQRWVLVIVLGASCLIVGCKSDSKADAMNRRDTWEASADEPKINSNTHFAAGQLAESQGNDENAEKQYKLALEVDEKNDKAIYCLGILYVRTKKYDEATDLFKQYVEVTDRSAVAYANLALSYQVAGKYDEAADAYEAGIKRDPKCVQCRVNYGLMLAHRGKFTEATVQLQTVLTPAEVHYNLGSSYEDLNRPEEARREYELALKSDPRFIDARVRLAALK